MPDTAIATASRSLRKFSRQPNNLPVGRTPNATLRKRHGNGGLSKAIKVAIEAQAFEGLTRAQSAERAGISEGAVYQALRKPTVLAYWNECLQVLRTGQRARNVHRLAEIRDQDDNRSAAVQAIKVLEDAADNRSSAGNSSAVRIPGIQIVIATGAAHNIADDTIIEVNPLMDNESIPVEDEERDE